MAFAELESIGPEEVKDYVSDWTEEIDAAQISESTWEITSDQDGTLIIGDGVTPVNTDAGVVTPPGPSIAAGLTTLWVSGGTDGETYTFCNQIRRNDGRVQERCFTVKCEEK